MMTRICGMVESKRELTLTQAWLAGLVVVGVLASFFYDDC
jgi:hypothetical protein